MELKIQKKANKNTLGWETNKKYTRMESRIYLQSLEYFEYVHFLSDNINFDTYF